MILEAHQGMDSGESLGLFDRLKKDDLLKAGGLMLIATVFTGGLDYLFQVSMGRALGPEDYGVLGSLGALSYFFFFLFERTIRVTTAWFVSRRVGPSGKARIGRLYLTIFRWVAGTGMACFLMFVALSWSVADYLHIGDVRLVLIFGLASLFSGMFNVNLGLLQGLERFRSLAMNNIARSVLKIALGIGLVWLGFGLYGAVGAVLSSVIFALLVSFFSTADQVQGPKTSGAKAGSDKEKLKARDVLLFVAPTMATMACLAIPTNVDVIMVKHFFSSEQTGLFTAISIFGRLVLFIPVGITTVLFPMIVKRHVDRIDPRPLLSKGLLFTGALTGAVALLLYLVPGAFLSFFYGDKYLDAQDLLRYYGLMVFFFSLTQVLVFYHLARSNFGFLTAFCNFMVLEVVAISVIHASMDQMVMVLLVMNAVLFLIGTVWTFLGASISDHRSSDKRGPGRVVSK